MIIVCSLYNLCQSLNLFYAESAIKGESETGIQDQEMQDQSMCQLLRTQQFYHRLAVLIIMDEETGICDPENQHKFAATQKIFFSPQHFTAENSQHDKRTIKGQKVTAINGPTDLSDFMLKMVHQKSVRISSILGIDHTDGSCSLQAIACLLDRIYVCLQATVKSYTVIETSLQQQESINRSLIKRELEFREEHKQVVEELKQYKNRANELDKYLGVLSEDLNDKDLLLNHAKNQLKASKREKQNLSRNNNFVDIQCEGLRGRLDKFYLQNSQVHPKKKEKASQSHAKQSLGKIKLKEMHKHKRRKSEGTCKQSIRKSTKRKNSGVGY